MKDMYASDVWCVWWNLEQVIVDLDGQDGDHVVLDLEPDGGDIFLPLLAGGGATSGWGLQHHRIPATSNSEM